MAATGYGLIETMRVREGRIPYLARHLARLERSLEALGMPRPSRDLAALVTPFAGTDDALLRLEVWDGRAVVTVRALPSLDPPSLITASEPHAPYPHKSTERDCFTDAAGEAVVAEVDDALLLTHEGWVAEGTAWSVCWWEGGGLCTAPLGLGILPGIGRARVLELAPATEVRCARRQLEGKSLFLVNAVRGVVPIASLDGARVPEDARTLALAGAFWPPAD